LTVRPDQSFGTGRDELAMQPSNGSGVVDVDDSVVEGARGVALGDPEGHPHSVGLCRVANPVQVRTGDLDGLILKAGVPLGIAPGLLAPEPVGVAGHEGFREHHELCAVGSCSQAAVCR